MKNNSLVRILALFFALVIVFSAVACDTNTPNDEPTTLSTDAPTQAPTEQPTEEPTDAPTEPQTQAPTEPPTEPITEKPTEAPTEPVTELPTEPITEAPTDEPTEAPTEPAEIPALTQPEFTIPEYSEESYCEINGNVPSFTENQIVTESYEHYSELDSLGRCGITVACLGKDLMPTEERGSISSVTPTGWHSGGIYERAHLIAFQLAGENANEKNLVAGTYDLNGVMQTFEEMIASYIKETNNHVMYRVTPVFDGDNLLCSGVWMEAYSVEDDGEGISFNIFIYNVQRDYNIDYATGDFELSEDSLLNIVTYVLNKNSKKYHYPTCKSVADMKESNKIYYYGTEEELLEEYQNASPCGSCKP